MIRLSLYYPVKPYSLYQGYGESKGCINTNKDVTGKNPDGTCPVGFVDLYNSVGLKSHNGEDIPTYHGQPVYHAGPDGYVIETSTEEARGLGVVIATSAKYDMGIHGEHHIKLLYWHLKSFTPKVDDFVKTGDLIGYADNTGYSGGDHLHFEIKPCEKAIANGQQYFQNVFQTNGWFGAVDPHPFYNAYSAEDNELLLGIWNLFKSALESVVNYYKGLK